MVNGNGNGTLDESLTKWSHIDGEQRQGFWREVADSERCSSDSAALRRIVVEQTQSMCREPEKV